MKYYLNRVIKPKATFGGDLPSEATSSTLANLTPLSNDADPRVKKLKKVLEGLSIAPKPKYIKIFN